LITYLAEDGQVTLRWESILKDTYTVEWSSDGFLTKQVSPELSMQTYVVPVTNWTPYKFRIRAIQANTTSDPITVTTVSAPPIQTLSAKNPYSPTEIKFVREPNLTYVFEYSTSASFVDFASSFSETLSGTKTLTEPGVYLCRLRATNGVVSTGYSYSLVTIRAIPAAPMLSVDPRNPYQSSMFRWNADFTTHSLEMSTTADFATKTVVPLTENTYTHESLGTTHVRVRSSYDDVFTAYSNPVQVTRFAIPAAPTLSVDSRNTYQEAVFRWNIPDTLFSHSLEISTSADFATKNTVTLTDTTYTHTSLGTYHVRIRSTYAGLFTAYSTSIQVTRLAIPAAPIMTIAQTNSSDLVVTWNATGFDNFLLEYSTTPDFSNSTIINTTNNSYTIEL
jgi:hypothetical protein